MSHDWDEFAATWDETGPAQYADEAAASLYRQATTFDLPLKQARVFDFGCGTGLLSERLAPVVSHIVALDPSKGMIEQLAAKIEAGLEGVEAVQGFLDEEMVRSALFVEPFDLVVASSVCAFLDDYPATVNRLATLLRPGGAFVQWDWEWSEDDEEPFGLTRPAISQVIQAAGLEVLSVETGFTVTIDEMTLAPLMGIGRKSLDP